MRNYVKYWLITASLFFGASGFASSSTWIHLDKIDASERQAILKKEVFTDQAFFPPLYQAAYDLQQLFEVGGIKATANFGAVLGIFRFDQALLWDDDIDYIVTVDQEEKLKALVPLADKLGYDLFPDDIVRYGRPGDASVGYKLYRREQFLNPETQEKHWIFIDIFLYQPDEKDPDKYVPVREKARKLFPKAWRTKKELDNVTFRQCGPIKKMPCSIYAKDQLYRSYGEDCERTALVYFSHYRDLKNNYIWTIKPEDDYPDHKNIKLENRVAKLLSSMPIAALRKYVCKEKQQLLEEKPISEIVSALIGDESAVFGLVSELISDNDQKKSKEQLVNNADAVRKIKYLLDR